MSGRKRNNNFVKLEFELIKVGGRYAAKCLVCTNTLKNTAANRLQSHRNICIAKSETQSTVKRIEESRTADNSKQCEQETADLEVMHTYVVSEEGTLTPMDATTNAIAIVDITTPTANSSGSFKRNLSASTPSGTFKRPKTICSYFDILKEEEEKKINEALSMFIFGCNLPFNIVESPLFKDFIKSIRPAYLDKIPSRKKLSTTFLNKCYDDCIIKTKRHVKEEAVILCDGWKNAASNSKIVVTMLHGTYGANAFLEAWDLTMESETGDKLAEIITKSADIAKNKYDVNVYGIVSDNASAMAKMGALLKHSMWHSTCSSHTGNLLAKDILDKKLVENVKLVLKEFKQPDFEKIIVMKGGHRIKLPDETRWCSYRDSFKNLLENVT